MVTQPLVVIVGPTASGKTSLAIKLAEKFNGEIISADSRTIYCDLNIGTAKPTAAEQKRVKHWGIDLVDPNQRFTVADYQKYALAKIADIRGRGKIPFLVGGSGLYVDAVLFNYEFGSNADKKLRDELNEMTVEELQNYCNKHNILLPENYKNKRYLVRTIECKSDVKNTRNKIRDDTIVAGILVDGDELRGRIAKRVCAMFDGGIEEETRQSFAKYAPNFDGSPESFAKLPEALKSNIYPIVWRMLNGEISRDEAIALSEIDDWHLTKRQMTWFRRNPAIEWLPSGEIEKYLEQKICSESVKVI